ncbi:type II methionyl aminopeptidase [Candidatus Woesearchaeota archaeon]|nr:type II methionyl aminopeptidase [Candidatus Woesearchaeota archaeon]
MMGMYTKKEHEKFIEAGKIAAQARDYGASLIKVGVSLLEVTEAVEKKVNELEGDFAFPPQISLNDIAAHYCAEPGDKTFFKKGDMAKLDVGVTVDGYVGDCAVTIDLGDNEQLVKASREALDNAIKIIKPGITLGEIGKTIQETIAKHGFSPVRNLCGHGVGKYLYHGKPTIPNINTADPTKLEKGQVIAIEPFATSGAGMIYDSGVGNIYSQIAKKPVRNIITRQVLKEIEKFNNMPFTTRWLTRKFPMFKLKFALRELLNYEIIKEYPPLVEKNHGLVSQAEHTVIVDDKVIVTTKVESS